MAQGFIPNNVPVEPAGTTTTNNLPAVSMQGVAGGKAVNVIFDEESVCIPSGFMSGSPSQFYWTQLTNGSEAVLAKPADTYDFTKNTLFVMGAVPTATPLATRVASENKHAALASDYYGRLYTNTSVVKTAVVSNAAFTITAVSAGTNVFNPADTTQNGWRDTSTVKEATILVTVTNTGAPSTGATARLQITTDTAGIAGIASTFFVVSSQVASTTNNAVSYLLFNVPDCAIAARIVYDAPVGGGTSVSVSSTLVKIS